MDSKFMYCFRISLFSFLSVDCKKVWIDKNGRVVGCTI
jgi:hypothetical protein